MLKMPAPELEGFLVLGIIVAFCIVRIVYRIFRTRYVPAPETQAPDEIVGLQEDRREVIPIEGETSSLPALPVDGDRQSTEVIPIEGETSSLPALPVDGDRQSTEVTPIEDATSSSSVDNDGEIIEEIQIQEETSSLPVNDDCKCKVELKTGDIVMLENQMPDNTNNVAAIDTPRKLFQINEFKDGEDGKDLVVLLDFDLGSEVSYKRADLKVTKVPIGLNKGDVVEITGQSDGGSNSQDKLMDSNGTIVVSIGYGSDERKVSVKRSSESREYDVDIQNLMVPEQMLSFTKNDMLVFVCNYKYGSAHAKRICKGQIVEFVEEIENSNLVRVALDDNSIIRVSKYLLKIDLRACQPIRNSVATLLCDYKPSGSEQLEMKKNDQVTFKGYVGTRNYFATVIDMTNLKEKVEVPASLLKNTIEDINEEIKYCSPGEIVEFAKRYCDASGHKTKYYAVSTKAMIKGHTQSQNKAIIEVFTKDKKTIVVPIQYLKIPEEVMNFNVNDTLNLRHEFIDEFDTSNSRWSKYQRMILIAKDNDSNQVELRPKKANHTFKVPIYRLKRPNTYFDFKKGELVEFILPFKCYGIQDKEFKKGKCVRFVRFEEGSHSRAIVTSRSIFKKKEEFCVPSRLLQRKLESTKDNFVRRLSFKS